MLLYFDYHVVGRTRIKADVYSFGVRTMDHLVAASTARACAIHEIPVVGFFVVIVLTFELNHSSQTRCKAGIFC